MIENYITCFTQDNLKRINERISCTRKTKLLNHTYIICKTAETTSILNVKDNGTKSD